MARKYLKAAAAHARAQRAAQHLVLTQDGHLAHEQNSFDSGSDSDSDVGYAGGVNCDGSDSDDTEDWNDSGSESSSSFSELEGTENNLKELREEAEDLKGTAGQFGSCLEKKLRHFLPNKKSLLPFYLSSQMECFYKR